MQDKFKHHVPTNGWLNAFLTIYVLDNFDGSIPEEDVEFKGAEAIRLGWKGQTLTIQREDVECVLKCLLTALNGLDGQIEENRKSDPEGTSMDLKMVKVAMNLDDKLIRWNRKG